MRNQMVMSPMTSRDPKGHVVTPMRLKPNMSKTAGYAIATANY